MPARHVYLTDLSFASCTSARTLADRLCPELAWGITFLIAWFASTFDWAWSRGFEWNVVRVPVLSYAAVIGVIVLSGTVRLAVAPTDGTSIHTATLNRLVDLFIPGEMTRIAEGRVSLDERRRLDRQADPAP